MDRVSIVAQDGTPIGVGVLLIANRPALGDRNVDLTLEQVTLLNGHSLYDNLFDVVLWDSVNQLPELRLPQCQVVRTMGPRVGPSGGTLQSVHVFCHGTVAEDCRSDCRSTADCRSEPQHWPLIAGRASDQAVLRMLARGFVLQWCPLALLWIPRWDDNNGPFPAVPLREAPHRVAPWVAAPSTAAPDGAPVTVQELRGARPKGRHA